MDLLDLRKTFQTQPLYLMSLSDKEDGVGKENSFPESNQLLRIQGSRR